MRHLASVGGAILVGTALVAAFTTFRIWDQGARDEARTADAIVVLGAAQYNGTPSRIYEARLDHAVDLYEAGVAPVLIVTGGKAEGDLTTEAAAGRAYSLARGVPEGSILAEDEGRTTLESLEAVAVLMTAEGLSSAVFVSDRWHLLRVLRIATDEGIVAWGSPTATSPIDTNVAWQVEAMLHELGALGVYFLGGGHLLGDDSPARGG
ncbi:MAG TPA: YdcF family protein [Candidatus Limnocylindrales bacterium]|nr:YdcF family protein [Candidatus Limnocylindrales bacterium]